MKIDGAKIFGGGTKDLKFGTFTPLTYLKSIEVEHGLGITPRQISILLIDFPKLPATMSSVMSGTMFPLTKGWKYNYNNIHCQVYKNTYSNEINTYVKSYNTPGCTMDDVKFNYVVSEYDNLLVPGATYMWIALA